MNEVFENNPSLTQCFVTSDGQAFYQENDAKNYAKSLNDKEVTTVVNENLIEVNDALEVSAFDQEMSEFELAENDAKKAELEAELKDEAKEVVQLNPKVTTPEVAKTPAVAEKTTKK